MARVLPVLQLCLCPRGSSAVSPGAKRTGLRAVSGMNALRRVGTWRGWAGFHTRAPLATFDLRRVELTPLEQRKLTFDSQALATALQGSGFQKQQAELLVAALVTLTTANMDIVYKDMVTKSHQEIAVQQLLAHLDAVRKDMVILEKSEFSNLRSENTTLKRELEQLQNRLKEESLKVRAETKLDINLERSRVSDMFTEQDKKLMEATSEFHRQKADLENDNMEINKKMDLQVASLKTVLESLKLETVRYLAATVFSCLAIALGVYRLLR
ncbi:coiled-coil domain-containing protein 90B, mitochondrial isoform 1-T2 [Menidia menidia]